MRDLTLDSILTKYIHNNNVAMKKLPKPIRRQIDVEYAIKNNHVDWLIYNLIQSNDCVDCSINGLMKYIIKNNF